MPTTIRDKIEHKNHAAEIRGVFSEIFDIVNVSSIRIITM